MMLMVLAKNVWRDPQGETIPYFEFALDTLHVLEDEAGAARSFGETAVFHSGKEKLAYLLDVADATQTLMHRYSARGADVPHRSVDGSLRFLEMISLAMLF